MQVNQARTRSLLLNEPEALTRAFFKDKDGQPLNLAFYQSDFVSAVLSRKFDRIIFLAATQSGKSSAIANAIAWLALLSPNERIINISYTDDQAKIIFERVKAHLVEDSPEIRQYVDLNRSLLKSKEYSKSRMFMKNGTEIRVMSTGKGETEMVGESLLGFEGTVVIVDEAGSIADNVYRTKILRMLGATRSTGLAKMLILSGTPHKPGHFEESWHDDSFKKFKVDWRMAVKAGRMTEKFVESQRKQMTRSEFEAWYEAIFPSMTEDSVFDMKEVERNIVSEDPHFKGVKILSVDVARFGSDFTVYTLIDYCDDIYRVVEIIRDEHKKTTEVAGRIVSLNNVYQFDRILVDESGIGGGVLDPLSEQGITNAFGVIAGAKCTTEEISKNCLNLKAELYMKAKKLFEENRLKIIGRTELKKELRLMKKTFVQSGAIKIVDPEKSPDFADSLVYGLHSPTSGTFVILDTSPEKDNNLPW